MCNHNDSALPRLRTDRINEPAQPGGVAVDGFQPRVVEAEQWTERGVFKLAREPPKVRSVLEVSVHEDHRNAISGAHHTTLEIVERHERLGDDHIEQFAQHRRCMVDSRPGFDVARHR